MIKIALLFPGQGSQYNMMGKALIESSPEVRDIFQRTNEILGYDLLAIINEGNLEQLTRTEHAQPAIFAYSYAIFQSIWKEKKFFPSFMAGHSLGEFTALTCAEVFRYEDALRLVMERATIMQQATADGFGGMAAINGLHPLLVEEECERVSNGEDKIVVANYNSSNQVVISGAKSLVKVAMENLAKIGAITIPLQVSAPFHTPYLELSNQMFQRAIAQTPMSMLKWLGDLQCGREAVLPADRNSGAAQRANDQRSQMERNDRIHAAPRRKHFYRARAKICFDQFAQTRLFARARLFL